MSKEVVLYRCKGCPDLNIEKKHIYRIGQKGRFYTTNEEAKRVFGQYNYAISDIDILCPLCEAYDKGKIKVKFLINRIPS